MDASLPTPPEGRLLDVAQVAWNLKERGVKDIDDDYDIAPMLTLFRGDKLLADIMCSNVSRDEALALAHITSGLMHADDIVVSLDAHISTELNNPATGKPWGPGEMQSACNNEGACDLGIITDCILTSQVTKGGPTRQISRRYHVNHTAREVHWVDGGNYGTTEDPKQNFTGLVPDSLRQAIERDGPDLMAPGSLALAERDGLPVEELDVHIRIAAAHMAIATTGCSVMLYGHSEREGELIREHTTEEAIGRALERLSLPALLMRLKFDLATDEEKAALSAALTGGN